ncbi:MAG: PLP-dependent aminotransferase family protein [Sandaracinaceae bacterium]|jgi:2-aminoadipate transaminase|nr:PLP-dependent aminotransferase family protein [Sandaracinaceae bacterium]
MDQRIDAIQRSCAAKPGITSFGGGLPSENLFPRRQLADAAHKVISRANGAALQYGWPEGQKVLREFVSKRLRARGVDVTADDIIITSGAQQALALTVSALTFPGMRMHVGAETYPAALELFRSKNVTPTLDVDEAHACYAMQSVCNPRGLGMSVERHAEIFTSGLPIIIDEAYAELRFDGHLERPLICCARDRAWLIGTFSKTLAPGLRVGWLVPPRQNREQILQKKQDMDLQTGSLSQSVLAEFLLRFDFDAHLVAARTEYQRRADTLVAAVLKHFPQWEFDEPQGGFSVFARTNRTGDDAKFLAEAASHGVSFDPGRLFRSTNQSSPMALRLCYSNVKEDAIDDAMARLAKAWKSFAPPC